MLDPTPPQYHFELTLADYREALRANGTLQINLGSLGWFIAIGLAVLLPNATGPLLPPPALGRPSFIHALLQLLIGFGPILICLGFGAAFLARVYRNLKNPRPPSRFRAIAGWTFAILLAALHIWSAVATHANEEAIISAIAADSNSPVPPPASVLSHLTAPILMTLAYAFIGTLLIFFNRASLRRLWHGDRTLRRPKTLTITPTGLRFDDPLSQHFDTWLAITHFRQTKNLFLLYIARTRYYLIPKRAFPTPADLAAFEQTLSQNISPPSSAFPVLPAIPTPPPLPVN